MRTIKVFLLSPNLRLTPRRMVGNRLRFSPEQGGGRGIAESSLAMYARRVCQTAGSQICPL